MKWTAALVASFAIQIAVVLVLNFGHYDEILEMWESE